MVPAERFDGVLFDMDGVLVLSEPVHARAWKALLDPMGHRYDDAFYIDWVGIPDERLAMHLYEQLGVAMEPETLLREKRRIYRDLMCREKPCPPGLRNGLESLRDRFRARNGGTVPLAVVTSSPSMEMPLILQAVELHEFFSAFLGAQDVPHHKPDPAPYLAAAERLGLSPERCAVVEDSPPGVAAGRAAGCTVLAVASTYDSDSLADAHHIFADAPSAVAWLLEQV